MISRGSSFVSSADLEIVPGIVAAFRSQHPDVLREFMNLRTMSQVKKTHQQEA